MQQEILHDSSMHGVTNLYMKMKNIYRNNEVRKRSNEFKLEEINDILKDFDVKIKTNRNYYYSHTSKKTVSEVTYSIIENDINIVLDNIRNKNLAILKACKYCLLKAENGSEKAREIMIEIQC